MNIVKAYFFKEMNFMNSVLWLVLLIILSAVELMTMNFVTIWFAIGSLAALISSLFGISATLQIWIFAGVSAISLVLTKPFINKKIKFKTTETNADRLIGKTAIVTSEINENKFAGEVKINGQIWSAVSIDNNFIEKESKVKIIKIEGVKLVVEKIPVEQIN